MMNEKKADEAKIPAPPAIGGNVRKERRKQLLSLEALAAASGVSKAMLSQIESEKVNPTIATMWKIAHALQVDFEALLRGEGVKVKRFELNRRESITSLTADSAGTVIKVLSPISMADDLEMYWMSLEPGRAHRSSPHSPETEEYLTVLKGRVRVSAGKNTAELAEGDVILYECDVEHAIENLSDRPAELYMVVRFARKR